MAAPMRGAASRAFQSLTRILQENIRQSSSKPLSRTRKTWRDYAPNICFVTGIGLSSYAGIGLVSAQSPKQLEDGSAIVSAKEREICALDRKTITPPKVRVSRKVEGPMNKLNLKLTLFQYQTCPFCCKVRAFLDFFGIPYDVVEVDPVLRQQMKFSEYKKVPVLLVQDGDKCWQINESSAIISLLRSYLLEGNNTDFKKILDLYEPVKTTNEQGKEVTEVLNKYHLMYGDQRLDLKQMEHLKAEREWRQWADSVLVHVLSPNVYRTPDEALQAFRYFSDVGDWEQQFPTWERLLVIYVGAAAMYLVGKRLKKRHHLKDDVRESFYDACNTWCEAVGPSRPFLGGNAPNLADLSVYGILSSVEGCRAFKDVLSHTNIGTWYDNMRLATQRHLGSAQLPAKFKSSN